MPKPKRAAASPLEIVDDVGLTEAPAPLSIVDDVGLTPLSPEETSALVLPQTQQLAAHSTRGPITLPTEALPAMSAHQAAQQPTDLAEIQPGAFPGVYKPSTVRQILATGTRMVPPMVAGIAGTAAGGPLVGVGASSLAAIPSEIAAQYIERRPVNLDEAAIEAGLWALPVPPPAKTLAGTAAIRATQGLFQGGLGSVGRQLVREGEVDPRAVAMETLGGTVFGGGLGAAEHAIPNTVAKILESRLLGKVEAARAAQKMETRGEGWKWGPEEPVGPGMPGQPPAAPPVIPQAARPPQNPTQWADEAIRRGWRPIPGPVSGDTHGRMLAQLEELLGVDSNMARWTLDILRRKPPEAFAEKAPVAVPPQPQPEARPVAVEGPVGAGETAAAPQVPPTEPSVAVPGEIGAGMGPVTEARGGEPLAPQGATPAVAPSPAENLPGVGRHENVYSTVSENAYDTRYRVVDLDSLVLNDPEVQPRNAAAAGRQQQIQDLAGKWEAGRYFAGGEFLDRGPAIIGPDLKVESGNGRMGALKWLRDLAAGNNPAAKERLERFLAQQREYAARLGIDPEAVKLLEEAGRLPIIVRERVTDVPDRIAFAEEANARVTLGTGAVESAARDVQYLDDATLAGLNLGDAHTVDVALAEARNWPAVQAWLGKMPVEERGALINKEGNGLTREGVQRLKNALLRRVFDDAEAIPLLRAFTEDLSNNIRNVETAIYGELPNLAKVKAQVARGELPPEADPTGAIARAARDLAYVREHGIRPDEYAAQIDMQRGAMPADQAGWLMLMANARSAKQLRERFANYIDLLDESFGSGATTKPLGGTELPPPSIPELIAKAQHGKQTSMFGRVPAEPITEEVANAIVKDLIEGGLNRVGQVKLTAEARGVPVGVVKRIRALLNRGERLEDPERGVESFAQAIENGHYDTELGITRTRDILKPGTETAPPVYGPERPPTRGMLFREAVEPRPPVDPVITSQSPTAAGVDVPDAPLPYATQAGGGGSTAQGAIHGQPADTVTPPIPKSAPGKDTILDFIRQTFNIPISVGHMGVPRRVLGIFKPGRAKALTHRGDVIRTKWWADIDTSAHELGHHLRIEDKVGIRRQDLQPFEHELAGMASQGDPLEEGFAEFIRNYIVDPAHAQQAAPTFYPWFEQRLTGIQPAALGALQTVRDLWKAYDSLSDIEKGLLHIHRGNVPVKMRWTMDDFIYAVVNRWRPLENFDRAASITDPAQMASVAARLSTGSGLQADEALVGRGPFLYSEMGKLRQSLARSFKDIVSPVVDDLDGWEVYALARRTLERYRKKLEFEAAGKPLPKGEFRTGFTPEQARNVVEHYDRISPAYGQVLNELQGYQNALLDILVEGHVLSPEKRAIILEGSKDYIPLYRIIEDVAYGTESGSGFNRYANLYNPIKRFSGREERVYSPLESIIRNTYAYMNLAARNRVGVRVAQTFAKVPGLGHIIEAVPADKIPKIYNRDLMTTAIKDKLKANGTDAEIIKAIMDHLEDLPEELLVSFAPSHVTPKDGNFLWISLKGKPTLWQVHDPALFQVMTGQGEDVMSLAAELLALPTAMLRFGVTRSVSYMIRNIIRDQLMAGLQSESGYLPFFSAFRPKRIKEILKDVSGGDSDLMTAYRRTGAGMATIVSKPDAQRKLQQVFEGRALEPLNVIKHPVQALTALAELSETVTRAAEFERLLKQSGEAPGNYSLSTMLGAAKSARRVTIDFTQHGSPATDLGYAVKILRNQIQFFNPSIQGLFRSMEAARENPQRFAIAATVGIVVPSVLTWIAGKDNPRIQALDPWQRQMHWIIDPWHTTAEEWNSMSDEQKAAYANSHPLIRIPKPFEAGVTIGSGIEAGLDRLLKQNPDAMREWMRAVGTSVQPFDIPAGIKPILEDAMNYSIFRGRKLVPEGLEKVENEYKYTPYTTEFARLLGKYTGRPPAAIDNYISNIFGTVGVEATRAGDWFARSGKVAPVAPQWVDLPGLSALIAREPSTQSQNIVNLMRTLKRHQEIAETGGSMHRDRTDPSRYEAYTERFPNQWGARSFMNRVQQHLSKEYQDMAMIRASPDLTGEEKQLGISAKLFGLDQFARDMLQDIKTLDLEP